MTISLRKHADASPPLAAIDIGTNSVRLLIATVEDGRVVPLLRGMHQPRLGRGVDRAGKLDPAAASDTLAAVGDLVVQARRFRARSITVVGTSALRDAANRATFIDAVRREHGVEVTLLSGKSEAALSFYGATRGLLAEGGYGTAAEPPAQAEVFVLDVGGGSTELVYGTLAGEMLMRTSIDVGAVRLTEQCMTSDPPSPSDWSCLEKTVGTHLQRLWRPHSASGPSAHDRFAPSSSIRLPVLIGVGGTATTLAAIDLQLHEYDPERVHGHRLSWKTVASLLERMRRSTVAERRNWPGLQPQRADIIVAGSCVVEHVIRAVGADALVTSESDLLAGIVLRQAMGEAID